jgi:hypothetical protein
VIRTYLYRSDDGGGTWKQLDYDGEGGAVSSKNPPSRGARGAGPASLSPSLIVDVRAAATSPIDPDLVYLRLEDHHATRSVLVRAHGGDGPPPGGSARYTPVLEAEGRISVAVTVRDELLVSGTRLGLRRSRDRGRTWEVLLPAPGPPCVATWENRIFVCGTPGTDGYVAAELNGRRQLTPLVLWRNVQLSALAHGEEGRREPTACTFLPAPPGVPKVGPAAPFDVRASRCPAEWERWKKRLSRPAAR